MPRFVFALGALMWVLLAIFLQFDHTAWPLIWSFGVEPKQVIEGCAFAACCIALIGLLFGSEA